MGRRTQALWALCLVMGVVATAVRADDGYGDKEGVSGDPYVLAEASGLACGAAAGAAGLQSGEARPAAYSLFKQLRVPEASLRGTSSIRQGPAGRVCAAAQACPACTRRSAAAKARAAAGGWAGGAVAHTRCTMLTCLPAQLLLLLLLQIEQELKQGEPRSAACLVWRSEHSAARRLPRRTRVATSVHALALLTHAWPVLPLRMPACRLWLAVGPMQGAARLLQECVGPSCSAWRWTGEEKCASTRGDAPAATISAGLGQRCSACRNQQDSILAPGRATHAHMPRHSCAPAACVTPVTGFECVAAQTWQDKFSAVNYCEQRCWRCHLFVCLLACAVAAGWTCVLARVRPPDHACASAQPGGHAGREPAAWQAAPRWPARCCVPSRHACLPCGSVCVRVRVCVCVCVCACARRQAGRRPGVPQERRLRQRAVQRLWAMCVSAWRAAALWLGCSVLGGGCRARGPLTAGGVARAQRWRPVCRAAAAQRPAAFAAHALLRRRGVRAQAATRPGRRRPTRATAAMARPSTSASTCSSVSGCVMCGGRELRWAALGARGRPWCTRPWCQSPCGAIISNQQQATPPCFRARCTQRALQRPWPLSWPPLTHTPRAPLAYTHTYMRPVPAQALAARQMATTARRT
jgi:hypothetical protein